MQGFDRILKQSLRVRQHVVPHLLTVEELLRYDPQMPRAVAEYQVKKMNEGRADFDFLERDYARVDSTAELARLSPSEAAARWLEARSPQYQQELVFREAKKHPDPGCPADSTRAVIPKLKLPSARILGSAVPRDSIAYVLVGSDFPGAYQPPGDARYEFLAPPSVLILDRVGDGWKVFPLEDMPRSTGMSGAMGFVIGCGHDEVVDIKPGH